MLQVANSSGLRRRHPSKGREMTPSERIATAVIAACMIGFIALLVWEAL